MIKKNTAHRLLLCESITRSLLDPFLVALFKPVAFIVRHCEPSLEPGAGVVDKPGLVCRAHTAVGETGRATKVAHRDEHPL